MNGHALVQEASRQLSEQADLLPTQIQAKLARHEREYADAYAVFVQQKEQQIAKRLEAMDDHSADRKKLERRIKCLEAEISRLRKKNHELEIGNETMRKRMV